MRKIKKEHDWVPKLIAGLFLGGVGLLVLGALGVVGYLIWNAEQKPMTETPVSADNPPPNLPTAIRAPNLPTVELHSLPPPEPLKPELTSPPPRPSEKPVDIVAVRSFMGHAGPVFGAALSANAHRVLSGGEDKTVRLWDLDTGKELAKLEGHTAAIRAVAFAPDGKRAASAGDDGTIRLWDLAEKKTLRAFTGHDGGVRCLAFTPDGKQLLSGGVDRSLRVWEVETGKIEREVYGHDAPILCVSVAPDGTQALTGSADGGAMLWELKTGRELCYLSVGKPVYFALFTPDGKRAVVGGDAPSRLCDLTNGEQWTEERQGGDPLRGAALMPSGTVVLHGGVGKRLESRVLWTKHLGPFGLIDPTLNQLGQVQAHNGTITCVCASRDGRLALTAGEDGAVKLWRIIERAGAAGPGK
jgi:WD40 repeat protein